MNYSRGIQPSCTSETEYKNSLKKRWHDVKENPPANGQCVLICYKNGENDSDFWTTAIAYYCNKDFYCLEYDPHLDVLRKQYVKQPDLWAGYWVPAFDD